MSQALEIQRCNTKGVANPKYPEIRNQKLNFHSTKKTEVRYNICMYNPLPHHLELVVYLTQMQDDHLNDPLANSATCSKAKIGSKAEEASRPKKSCCCFTKFPELILKGLFPECCH